VTLLRSLAALRVRPMRCCRKAGGLSVLLCLAWPVAAQRVSHESVPTFGTTVVESAGLRGDIYFVKPGIERLPNFKRLKPVGTIYTTRLNVPPTNFQEGFPGITGRLEWFAIDYRGQFYVSARARYQFGLNSDDGSKLYIDTRAIIDNDGIHPLSGCQAIVELEAGVHSIRVSYMQGPGFIVSLQLLVARPGDRWQVFDTRNFLLPENGTPESSRSKVRRAEKISGGDCWALH
jgi:hypothetical protein